ncbi:hypothetical protein KKI22_01255 [Patescibacteria group bacterium]|nr:hypothetical protein [Patescibacteria group bacterium]
MEPQILVNEVYPNPETGSEWVELIVTEKIAEDFSIEDYTIFDSYHQIYRFSDDEQFLNQLLVVEVSGLNNDQDSVIIKNATGNIIDSFSYTETEKGLSWAREIDSSIFSLSEASCNLVNPLITPAPTEEPNPTISPTATPTPTLSTIPTANPTNPAPSPKKTKKYHYYDLSKIKLESQDKIFENRTGRLVFFGKKQGQAEVLGAIIGSSLIILSALFLIYAKVKSKHH